jgi:hypothetical protein
MWAAGGPEKWATAPQLDDFRPGGRGGHLEDSHVVDHFRRGPGLPVYSTQDGDTDEN